MTGLFEDDIQKDDPRECKSFTMLWRWGAVMAMRTGRLAAQSHGTEGCIGVVARNEDRPAGVQPEPDQQADRQSSCPHCHGCARPPEHRVRLAMLCGSPFWISSSTRPVMMVVSVIRIASGDFGRIRRSRRAECTAPDAQWRLDDGATSWPTCECRRPSRIFTPQ